MNNGETLAQLKDWVEALQAENHRFYNHNRLGGFDPDFKKAERYLGRVEAYACVLAEIDRLLGEGGTR